MKNLLIMAIVILLNCNISFSSNQIDNTSTNNKIRSTKYRYNNTINKQTKKQNIHCPPVMFCDNQKQLKELIYAWNNPQPLENPKSKIHPQEIFDPMDAYIFNYAIYHPEDHNPNQSVQKEVEKVKETRDCYIAPEEYNRFIANRLIGKDNIVNVPCPFEKDPDL